MSDTEKTTQPGDGPDLPDSTDAAGTGAAQPSQEPSPRRAWAQAARQATDDTPAPPPMNPYMAGVFLGLTLLASYLILGAGLGASGAFARLGAWIEHLVLPARVEASAYFGPWFPAPLS